MANPLKFQQEVRSETSKVTWPTRNEVAVTTAMVFILVFLASVFFFLADQLPSWIVSLLLDWQGDMAARWYIVNAYSNFEHKVESIREQAEQAGLDGAFEEILVPTEEVEMRRGRRVNSERKFFPGYVLVKMDMTDEAYHLVKNTPKVTGFLASQNKPSPINQAEVDRIVNQVQDGAERPKPSVIFEAGEQVRVSVTARLLPSTALWKRSMKKRHG